MRLKSLILLPIIVLTAIGCQDDEIKVKDVEYSRPLNFAAPVAIIDASCEAIFNRLSKDHNKTEFLIDSTDMLYVKYINKYTFGWDDILQLQDTIQASRKEKLNLPYGASLKRQYILKSRINTIEDQRLDSIFLQTAKIDIKSAPIFAEGKGYITIPELVNSKGDSFSANWTLHTGYTLKEGLENYVMYPTSNNNDSCYLTVILTLDGNVATDTASLNFDFKLFDLKPKVSYGYFGNFQLCNRLETNYIELFDNDDVPIDIEFQGSSVDLNVANRAGCQFDVTLDDMKFHSYKGIEKDFNFNINNSLFIEQNSVKDFVKEKDLKPKYNYFLLDSTNSNIDEVINIHPNNFDYMLNVVVNPHGENQVNFIDDVRDMKTDVNLYIPLCIRIKSLIRRDTVDFNLDDVFADENIDYVDKATVTLKIDNWLPVKVYAQGYFINEKGAVVDSLFESMHVISPTPEGALTRIKNWSHNDEVITLTNQQLTEYYHKDVNRLLIFTNITTEDSGDKFVKCYQEYGMKIKVTTDIVSKNDK